MQLDRMVNFYKALGDKTRIKLLIMLSANGPMSGLQLAEKLVVTPPTVSHHISKLKESSLIREKRDKNTIYYSIEYCGQFEPAVRSFEPLFADF